MSAASIKLPYCLFLALAIGSFFAFAHANFARSESLLMRFETSAAKLYTGCEERFSTSVCDLPVLALVSRQLGSESELNWLTLGTQNAIGFSLNRSKASTNALLCSHENYSEIFDLAVKLASFRQLSRWNIAAVPPRLTHCIVSLAKGDLPPKISFFLSRDGLRGTIQCGQKSDFGTSFCTISLDRQNSGEIVEIGPIPESSVSEMVQLSVRLVRKAGFSCESCDFLK